MMIQMRRTRRHTLTDTYTDTDTDTDTHTDTNTKDNKHKQILELSARFVEKSHDITFQDFINCRINLHDFSRS